MAVDDVANEAVADLLDIFCMDRAIGLNVIALPNMHSGQEIRGCAENCLRSRARSSLAQEGRSPNVDARLLCLNDICRIAGGADGTNGASGMAQPLDAGVLRLKCCSFCYNILDSSLSKANSLSCSVRIAVDRVPRLRLQACPYEYSDAYSAQLRSISLTSTIVTPDPTVFPRFPRTAIE